MADEEGSSSESMVGFFNSPNQTAGSQKKGQKIVDLI